MTLGITLLVLLAAVFHSTWNAIAKHIPHRLASATLIALVYLVAGAAGVAAFGLPAAEAWPFIAVSAGLQTGYLLLLTASYKHGDFSQIYPLARGLAVLLVAVVSVTLLAEDLSWVQVAGVAVVGGSLLSLALLGKRGSRTGVIFALLTGVCIAAYSLVDGVGVRESGDSFAYIAWLFLLQGVLLPVVCWLAAPDRRTYLGAMGRHWRLGSLGGLLSLLAYGIVVWAQGLAPLALVSALRESSVLLAGLVGFLFFGEKFSRARLGWTTAAVAGIVALQLG
ncbi:drug/metabolite transporter (DMT)-like permease [Arthrobacter stackebrandtii]|uniref:Drug/metabolite transporter (DMT)-like permease n=1 Tax=Arthrobacter stackebrandtii TaxID=272161 RepID=A0ABS4YV38_9MICC|nr:EamA family transporter [Arthrobacter stackebrandtii]MBP2412659.1 drug/metabolite transporter (DMT)-like permease [Arthrobacter stackebrandtii]PYG98816.1 EamA family transporter [Arthrobacter stackebrandtii]